MAEATWERTRWWKAWAGSTDDLRRLLVVVESQVDRFRRERLKKAYSWDRDDEPPEELAARVPALRLTITERNGIEQTVLGSAEECSALVDERTCVELTVTAPGFSGSPGQVVLVLRRSVIATVLRVSATPADVGQAVFSAIEREVEKNVPRWAPLRFSVAVSVPLAATALLVVPWFSRSLATDDQQSALALTILFGLMWAAAMVGLNYAISRWVLLPLDLYREGRSGATVRIWSFISGIVALALGIIIPMLLG